MQLSVLSYNLNCHSAFRHIDSILQEYHPDVICFQEMETDEEHFDFLYKHGYKLVDYSNSFIRLGQVYGIATFYNPEKLEIKESLSFNLPRGLYEVLYFIFKGVNNTRTALKSVFSIKNTNIIVPIYNVHLSPWATNYVRERQLIKTFDDTNIAESARVIIIGDFNYSYNRKRFEELINKYGLTEGTTELFYTLESRVLRFFSVRLKLDYVLFKGLTHISTNKLSAIYSDHFPILSKFEV